jgi:hypothetical protein
MDAFSSDASIGAGTLFSAGSTGPSSSFSSSLLLFSSFAWLWSALFRHWISAALLAGLLLTVVPSNLFVGNGFWFQISYCFYRTASRDFYCAVLAMLTERVGLVATLRVHITRREFWAYHSLE